MNPARYICPWCKASLKFPTPVRVGRVVRCPKCTCRFVAPEADLSTPSRSEAAAAAAIEGVLVAPPQTSEAGPAVPSPSEAIVAAAAAGEAAGEPVLTLEATSDEPVAAAAEGESAPVGQEKASEPVREEGGAEQPGPAPGEEQEKRAEPGPEGPRPGPYTPPVRKPPKWRPQRKAVRPPPRKAGAVHEATDRGWLGLRLSVLVLTLFSCLLTAGCGVLLIQWAADPRTVRMQETLAEVDKNPNLFPQEVWAGEMKLFRNLDRVVRMAYVLIGITPIALLAALFSQLGMGKTGGGILLATVPVPWFLHPQALVLSIGFLGAAIVSFLIGPSREWDVPTRFVVVYYLLGWGGFAFLCWVLYQVVVWGWIILLST